MRRARYGEWHGGDDPLAPPYDLSGALDDIGDAVLDGLTPAEALQQLRRQGLAGRRGLDDLLRQVRDRARKARQAGRLDGTLEQVRELLDQAIDAERRELFPNPSDDARLAEAELDALPRETARAVRELSTYNWQSGEARQAYEQIQDLLRREVLDSQFKGMKDALQNGDPESQQRVADMMQALNDMLDADARGEDTTPAFEEFMGNYGDFFPDNPKNLEELVDSLARRAAAAQRLMNSLSPEQQAELAGLMQQAMQDSGLAEQMARLSDQLRARRPELDWQGRQRMRGETPLGLGDATTALEESADLAELEAMLGQDYPGASIEDVDPELVERALGRAAVDDLDALRRVERELQEQGYLNRTDGELTLTPKGMRRLGDSALRRIFTTLHAHGRGDHDMRDAGAAGDPTGQTRAWEFGDEQPFDVVRTVRNAVLRSGAGTPVQIDVEDFEVVETERRSGAAVALLVDLSYSMALRGTWAAAKSTALALHSLVTTRYPQDAIEVIGFSRYARVLQPAELPSLSWDMVQGTNLQHALMLASRHLAHHPDAEPVVMVVTDGEPTAHLLPDGSAWFDWPTHPETTAATMAEVERVTRRGATINVFMLDDEPGLVRFVESMAARNGGRVFSPDASRLGEYVVSDYIRARRGRRARV
ncbi:MAG TPA: VWA domain-containing protein [Mycobacteriales bacterium]|nr:VWA domain-containing protein [Mycobacteriales bacterium]